MTHYIVFEDGTEFLQPVSPVAPVYAMKANGRVWRRIAITGATIEEIKAVFVDNAIYRHEWDSKAYDDSGAEIIERLSEDLSSFSVAGDVVDTRDGNFFVYMGKPSELDQANAELEAAAEAMAKGVNSIDE